MVSDEPVPLTHILTAAEAQVDYMLRTVPEGAKVLLISGGEQSWRGDLRTRGGAAGAALVDTWEMRTALSESEAKGWAARQAMVRSSGLKHVWVAFFHDGEVGGGDDDGAFQVPSSRVGSKLTHRWRLLLDVLSRPPIILPPFCHSVRPSSLRQHP
jgi:hypothetical protein